MKDRGQNPFQELYLTEALDDPELYWNLFSPQIITGEAERLFRVGNIILQGSNGTGKTMLLRLFSPEVQATFLRHGINSSIFKRNPCLGIGINFIHAGFGALGKRRVAEVDAENITLWSSMFADLLNYFLVYELLKALKFLSSDEGAKLKRSIGAATDGRSLDEFANWLSQRECWYGALSEKSTFSSLLSAVRDRIYAYRSFVNWNIKELPDHLKVTKSDIGVPLSECRKGLQECGILKRSIPLIVTVDQYETLFHIDYEVEKNPERSIGRSFCRVVNSLLATRNPKVSYKIGVRPYSWAQELRAFGTDARVEVGRDYQIVSLDEILRRQENTSAWIFPEFARDVASRRMASVFGGSPSEYKDELEKSLERLSAEDEIERYCRKQEDRLVPAFRDLPPAWNTMLQDLYMKNKFQSKLAEVWINQAAGRGDSLPSKPPASSKAKWNRKWWQKERREALLMQVASACRQRRIYGGWETLLTLGASNILIFLSLCREIWDIAERARTKSKDGTLKITPEFQSQAIRLVSETWLKKQDEFPGGAQRRDFITRLGIGFRKAILTDRGLIYPGHNGFSLLLEDYESPQGQSVRAFLDKAADFGALIASKHTTKERDGRLRKKWYLFPILCPNFEIPAIRTKEPYYATLDEVKLWLSTERPAIELRRSIETTSSQQILFDMGGGSK